MLVFIISACMSSAVLCRVHFIVMMCEGGLFLMKQCSKGRARSGAQRWCCFLAPRSEELLLWRVQAAPCVVCAIC